jgi:hypothetical protein
VPKIDCNILGHCDHDEYEVIEIDIVPAEAQTGEDIVREVRNKDGIHNPEQ